MKPGVSAERFFHLDGYNGWTFADAGAGGQVVVGPSGISLPRGELPPGDVPAHVTADVRARGLAFDQLGRAFAVADDRRAFCRVAGSECPPERPFGLEPRPKRRFGGIAIDRRERLVVPLRNEGEVRVLRLSPPAEIARIPMVKPVAVAIDSQGRLVVLDTGMGDPAPPSEPFGPVVRVARPGDAIAASPTGALAVVQRDATYLELALPGGDFERIELGRSLLPFVAFAREVDQDGGELVILGDRRTARIVMWRIKDGHPTPLRWGTEPGAWGALAYRGETLFALGPSCRIAPVEFEAAGFFERSRSFVIGPLDAGVAGTEWHRVSADLERIPNAEAGVSVEILADDDCEAYDPTLTASDSRWEPPRELVATRPGHPAELAFLSARGRYAYLRVTLHGDGRHSPMLRWLRVEFPRNSYLRYLPAIFSEEPVSRSVGARLLSLFEAEHVDLDAQIEDLYRLFTPYAIDPEFFAWLAERLDVLLQPDWPEAKTRAALADAFWLFQRRGTRAGLSRLLADHGGPGITLVEGHRQRTAFFLGDVRLGCGTVLPGSCAPQRVQLDRGVRLGAGRLDSRPFAETDPIVERRGELDIYLPPAIASNAELIARVERIAELEAPAGAAVRVIRVAAGGLSLGQV
jgi:phage tail-like protein